MYDSEWEEIVGKISGVLCVGTIEEVASMHTADSGCKLGMIGVLGALFPIGFLRCWVPFMNAYVVLFRASFSWPLERPRFLRQQASFHNLVRIIGMTITLKTDVMTVHQWALDRADSAVMCGPDGMIIIGVPAFQSPVENKLH